MTNTLTQAKQLLEQEIQFLQSKISPLREKIEVLNGLRSVSIKELLSSTLMFVNASVSYRRYLFPSGDLKGAKKGRVMTITVSDDIYLTDRQEMLLKELFLEQYEGTQIDHIEFVGRYKIGAFKIEKQT